MDVHRIVVGEQYFLQISFDHFPICCVMNEKMILVNQHFAPLVGKEGIVLCVYQPEKTKDLLTLPIMEASENAKQRGVWIGMEAKEAILLLQKEKNET